MILRKCKKILVRRIRFQIDLNVIVPMKFGLHLAKDLKIWLKIDGIELPSIDECQLYLENNLPNNDFVQAFFFNSTGNIDVFRRLFTDPIPGYYLTTDTIAVDLLVQVGFQNDFLSLIDSFRVLSSRH